MLAIHILSFSSSAALSVCHSSPFGIFHLIIFAEYVQVKPILALITIILKAAGKYNEGNLRANSGYLYVSIVYNISICMALYCLAIFWMCVNDDLKPFRYVSSTYYFV
jgi:hypothetical protein